MGLQPTSPCPRVSSAVPRIVVQSRLTVSPVRFARSPRPWHCAAGRGEISMPAVERVKLRMKIGLHELEAEGPRDLVMAQLDIWTRLAGLPPADARQPRRRRPGATASVQRRRRAEADHAARHSERATAQCGCRAAAAIRISDLPGWRRRNGSPGRPLARGVGGVRAPPEASGPRPDAVSHSRLGPKGRSSQAGDVHVDRSGRAARRRAGQAFRAAPVSTRLPPQSPSMWRAMARISPE